MDITQLSPGARDGVEALARVENLDIPAAIARLVDMGLAARRQMEPDVATVRAWAEQWPTCVGVLARPDLGRWVNVWHEDERDPGAPDEDILHREEPPSDVRAALDRLLGQRDIAEAARWGTRGTVSDVSFAVRCLSERERPR